MKLYGYWRSSASYRTRIALHLKELAFDYVPVHLVRGGGEQKQADYKKLNPIGLVPTLVDGDFTINQSLAIIEYLDTLHPDVRLIPADPQQAAIVRMLALDMAAELQPITNLRVLQYLTGTLKVTDEARLAWIHHWVNTTFSAFEQRLHQHAGSCCVGDTVSLADICLVPQVYNAKRFKVDLSPYPKIMAVYKHLESLAAFQRARPEAQPDAEPDAKG